VVAEETLRGRQKQQHWKQDKDGIARDIFFLRKSDAEAEVLTLILHVLLYN